MNGSAVPLVPLGEVITHRKQFIQIDDLETYQRCRVQLHAAGIVLRDIVPGLDIKTKRQQVCRAGEFLVAEIDAKVGGFGIVPPELDGAVVSSHYFLYAIDETKLDRRYLDYYVRTSMFREQVAAQGSTNYAAIRPQHVLDYTLPLPPLDEQRRIVGRIEAVARRVEEAQQLRNEATSLLSTLETLESRRAFPEPTEETVLGDYVRLQSGYAFKSEWFSDQGIRLVRNANIGHGTIQWGETVRLPESRRGEFERFELSEGDILVTLDRPVISTGVKVARVTATDVPSLLLQRVARVQFLTNQLCPDYLFAWLRSPWFVSAIDPGRSNGVPHISPKDVERIPFALPSQNRQREAVLSMRSTHALNERMKVAYEVGGAQLRAIVPAFVRQALGGARWKG